MKTSLPLSYFPVFSQKQVKEISGERKSIENKNYRWNELYYLSSISSVLHTKFRHIQENIKNFMKIITKKKTKENDVRKSDVT